MIGTCPVCGSKLVKKEAEANYYCQNSLCDARNIEKLGHFSSSNTMNIDGFGEKIIEAFFNFGYLKDIVSIYDLKKYKDELMELEGFGEKSINNLLDAIEKSKNNSLEKLLFGLGIRHFGEKSAKVIAANFPNIDLLIKANIADIIKIKDVGDIMGDSICKYFDDDNNIIMINELKKRGVNMNYHGQQIIKNEAFSDKKFVITGTISLMTRDKLKEKITSLGGIVIEAVSKKTDVVIVGDNPGSKYEKALSLGLDIWDEEKLKNILYKEDKNE